MKNKSIQAPSKHKLEIERFNLAERNMRLKNLLSWLEAATKHKPYKEYPAAMHSQQTILEQINKMVDESVSAKKCGDSRLEQSLMQHALDGLLNLLQEESQVSTAPTVVFKQLLEVLTAYELYFESNQVAEFLYYKRHFINVRVLMALMLQASRLKQYAKALEYFERNTERLSDKAYHAVYEQYLRIKIAQGKSKEVIKICLNQLQTVHRITYENQTFVRDNEEIAVDLTNRNIQSFLILLVNAYLKQGKANLEDASHIATLLQKAFPEHVEITLLLAQCYSKQKRPHAVLELYANYLENSPNLGVFVHCMHYLIKQREYKLALSLYHVFIAHYQNEHHSEDFRNLQLLYAWFLAEPVEGKELLIKLKEESPDNPMIVYASIVYALKHRDRAWLEALIQSVQKQFSSKTEIVKYVRGLSEVRILCATIESSYFDPDDILRKTPKYLAHCRQYVLPPQVETAFQRLCRCAQKTCTSTCLDKVFLTGSALDVIIAWNEALEQGLPFDIDSALSDRDFDFIVIVDEIPEESPFPGFQRCLHRPNLFRFRENDLEIDISYYKMSDTSENFANDILTILKDHGDMQHRRIIMDQQGFAQDYANGKAFWASDNHIIALHGDPTILTKEDPMRVLRVAKAVLEKGVDLNNSEAPEKMEAIELTQEKLAMPAMDDILEETDSGEEICKEQEQQPHNSIERPWTIAASLAKSLRLFVPPLWLSTAQHRKRFLSLITHPDYGENFFHFMSKYGLLCHVLQASTFEACISNSVAYLRKQGNLATIHRLIKEQEKKCTSIEETMQKYELEKETQAIKNNLSTITGSSKPIQQEIDQKKGQYKKTVDRQLTSWKKNDAPQLVKNAATSLMQELAILQKKHNNAEQRHQNDLQKIKKITKQIKDYSEKINKLKKLSIDQVSNNKNKPIPEVMSLFFMQKPNKPLFDLDLDSTGIWVDTDPHDVFTVLSTVFDPCFSALLYFNLGCIYFYKGNEDFDEYQLAWLCFKLAETRLHLLNDDPQIINFVNTVLSPIIQKSFQNSQLDQISKEELVTTIETMPQEFTDNDFFKVWVCIEYSLSSQDIDLSTKENILRNVVLEYSDLMSYDFFYYLSLCDLALSLGILQPAHHNKVKNLLWDEIKSNNMSPYLIQYKDTNSIDSCLTNIQFTQNIPRFTYVRQLLEPKLSATITPPLGSIPLLKMGFFCKFEEFSDSRGALNNLCVSYIHIAEGYAAQRQYASAKAYYQLMLREVNKTKIYNLFSILYPAWAQQRLYMLELQEKDLNEEISIIPLFEQMLTQWQPKRPPNNGGFILNSLQAF